MGDLSKNFMRREFACKGSNCCGGAVPMHPALISCLQLLREDIDEPIKINSGFRCPTHNAAIGGSSNSQHCLGKAADIAVPDGVSMDRLLSAINKIYMFRNGGVIIYDSWVHVDVRPEPYRGDERT